MKNHQIIKSIIIICLLLVTIYQTFAQSKANTQIAKTFISTVQINENLMFIVDENKKGCILTKKNNKIVSYSFDGTVFKTYSASKSLDNFSSQNIKDIFNKGTYLKKWYSFDCSSLGGFTSPDALCNKAMCNYLNCKLFDDCPGGDCKDVAHCTGTMCFQCGGTEGACSTTIKKYSRAFMQIDVENIKNK